MLLTKLGMCAVCEIIPEINTLCRVRNGDGGGNQSAAAVQLILLIINTIGNLLSSSDCKQETYGVLYDLIMLLYD
jgi:hypothetical protein